MNPTDLHTLKDLAKFKVVKLLYNNYDAREMLEFVGDGFNSFEEQLPLSIHCKVWALGLPDVLQKTLVEASSRIWSRMVKIKRLMASVHEEVRDALGHNCVCTKHIKEIFILRIPDCVINNRNIFRKFIRDERPDVLCRFFMACKSQIPDCVMDVWEELSRSIQMRLVAEDIPFEVRYWAQMAEDFEEFDIRLMYCPEPITFDSFIQNYERLSREANLDQVYPDQHSFKLPTPT